MNIAIVGASGFVGRSVVAAARAAGHSVIPVVRAAGAPAHNSWPTSDRRPATSDQQRAVGDFERVGDWASVLRGADAVVYLAARVHVMHEQSADALASYRPINRDVPLRVAEAAGAAGIRRLVYVSTLKVHGERTVDMPIDEQSPITPVGPYAQSKAEAEDALAALAARTGVSVVAIRPPLVMGAGAAGNIPRLRQLARVGARIPLPFGSVRNRRSYVFREHLSDAIVRLASHSGALRHAYVVSDTMPVSTPDLLREVGRALGLRVRLASVPVALLRLAGAMARRSEEVGRLVDSLEVRSDALRRDLGWESPAPLSAVIAATFASNALT